MKKSTLNHSKKIVFQAIENALAELQIEIEDYSIETGRIQAYFGGNLLSFGNNIEILVKSVNQQKTTVKVESISAAQVQLIDWGTNEKLEKKIISGIKDFLRA